MREKSAKSVLLVLFISVISFCALFSSSAIAQSSSDQESLIIPSDKCIFIDTHTRTEGIGDVGGGLEIDFPTYSMEGYILSSWVPISGFGENTKVLVGRGESLSGTAGGGAGTSLSAYNTDSVENYFYFDADATVHFYYNEAWRTVNAGDTWTETADKKPQTGDGKLIDTYTVTNYGFMAKSEIIIPTPAFTNTPPVTAKATPTATAKAMKVFNLSGYIKPSFNSADKNVNSGFTVEVIGTGKSATTDEDGFFEIEGVPAKGRYSLKISKRQFLTRTVELICTGGSMEIQGAILASMWVGDIVEDNAINMRDILAIAASFNSSLNDSRYNKDVDVNKDGAVNMQDIMIVAANFNKTSSNYDNKEIKFLGKINLIIGNTAWLNFSEGGPAGLKWKYEIENESIIKLESSYVEEMVPGNIYANRVYKFAAVAEGRSKLTFKSTAGEEIMYLVTVSKNSTTVTPTSTPVPTPEIKKIYLMLRNGRFGIELHEGGSAGSVWNYEIENGNVVAFDSEGVVSANEGSQYRDELYKHRWYFTPVSEGTSYITFRSKNGNVQKFFIIVTKEDTMPDIPPVVKEVNLKVGEVLEVNQAHGGFVGVTWDYEIENDNVVVFDSRIIGQYHGDLQLNTWHFKAAKEGTSQIIFSSNTGKTDKYLITVSR